MHLFVHTHETPGAGADQDSGQFMLAVFRSGL